MLWEGAVTKKPVDRRRERYIRRLDCFLKEEALSEEVERIRCIMLCKDDLATARVPYMNGRLRAWIFCEQSGLGSSTI